jgi:hypothetical protein
MRVGVAWLDEFRVKKVTSIFRGHVFSPLAFVIALADTALQKLCQL